MDDSEIIELYFSRSEQALAATSDKYGAYLNRIAAAILHNAQDAQETVNDVLHRAWNAIPPAHPEKLRYFLARIARNAAIDRLDYLRAQKRSGDTDTLISELGDCIPADTDVEAQTLAKELGQQINTFLSSLAADKRRFFLLRYFHALSIQEIGEQTGASEAKIKSSLFRTRKKLQNFLKQEGIL